MNTTVHENVFIKVQRYYIFQETKKNSAKILWRSTFLEYGQSTQGQQKTIPDEKANFSRMFMRANSEQITDNSFLISQKILVLLFLLYIYYI